jgi:hypothetical protein
MNGALDKPHMKGRAIKLKNELYGRCERQELTYEECRGAEQYLNKVLDIVDEYAY